MRFRILFILCLYTFTDSTAQQESNSPLDSNPATNNSFWDFGDEYSKLMPPCEMACMDHVMGALKMFFAAGNISATKDLVCEHYSKAEKCMRPLTQCQDTLFPVITSGIRYMCIEQREAFEVLIDCIDANSPLVKRDCDLQCHPHSFATGLVVKDTVMQSLDQPLVNQAVNMRNIIEPHLGRIFFSEGCRISECLLNCYKTKFNMLCDGTAGSLITEVLSRPLSHHEGSLGTQFLSTFVGRLLPHTCSFLSQKGMAIHPDLDKEIKRMYKGRKKPSAMDIHQLGQPTDAKNPFEATMDEFLRSSPLEVNKQDDMHLSSGNEDVTTISDSIAEFQVEANSERTIRPESSGEDTYVLECSL